VPRRLWGGGGNLKRQVNRVQKRKKSAQVANKQKEKIKNNIVLVGATFWWSLQKNFGGGVERKKCVFTKKEWGAKREGRPAEHQTKNSKWKDIREGGKKKARTQVSG